VEAKRVAAFAQSAGWRPHVLTWRGPKPLANIEDEARKARYRLLGRWCMANSVEHLFVAHSRDDLVETFLLRLGRGSGVDGLSAMRARAPFPFPGFGALEILRPLLDFGRAEIRAYLERIGAQWIEDPMNGDTRFARVRVRALLPSLEEAGITQHRIADAARHLARAREALDAEADKLILRSAREEDGAILLDRQAMLAAPREIGLRSIAALLRRVGGASYRPRFERLEALYDALRLSAESGTKFAARTLHSCRVGPAPRRHQIFGPGTLEIKAEIPRMPKRRKASPK